MGAYFASLQGGIFTSPRVAAVLEGLRADGVTGLGQSSWGPTGFAFAASEHEGQEMLSALRQRGLGAGLRLVLARGATKAPRSPSAERGNR
ncbi:hypothetical protein AUC69_13000 [Methyloceanibacter superfactus]|uniref:GHMP kinase C-terminal domain-containing protein n=2 Tax=Methyloceanibacter superfactus TaxID=1774969 RepID=A0A1E3VU50_9HYPH|nr:hypothetical protein AUC69_13000 [Methyloceanibacter superfactus]